MKKKSIIVVGVLTIAMLLSMNVNSAVSCSNGCDVADEQLCTFDALGEVYVCYNFKLIQKLKPLKPTS